jgi:hypothetical protein
LVGFPGNVGCGSIENAQMAIPYPGSHLTQFTYPSSSLALSVGVPMTPISPTILPAGAIVTLFEMTPRPPPGLTLNNGTGVLSGTPTQAQGATVYRMQVNAATAYYFNLTISIT